MLPPHGQTLNSSSAPRRCEPAQHNSPATNPLSTPSYSSLSEPTLNEFPQFEGTWSTQILLTVSSKYEPAAGRTFQCCRITPNQYPQRQQKNRTSTGPGSCSLTDVPTKAQTAPLLKCPPQNMPPESLLLEGWIQHTTLSPAEAQQPPSRHLILKRHGELSHDRKGKGSSVIFHTQQTGVYIHSCFLALLNSFIFKGFTILTC